MSVCSKFFGKSATTRSAWLTTVSCAILNFPFSSAQSATLASSKPLYCGTEWYSVYSPTYTIDASQPSITPPLPCPGAYSAQNGFCCSGSCVSCPGASACLLSNVNFNLSTSYPDLVNFSSANPKALRLIGPDGPSDSKAFHLLTRALTNTNGSNSGDELGFMPPNATGCSCSDGDIVYQLPLDPCVQQNPFYTGCPGNMAAGYCCSGPGIGFNTSGYDASSEEPSPFDYCATTPDASDSDSSSSSSINSDQDVSTTSACAVPIDSSTTSASPMCIYNTALYTVTTNDDGSETTSTFPPDIGHRNTLCYTCPLYTRSTSASKAGAPRTAAVPLITAGATVGKIIPGAAAVGAVVGWGLG